RRRHRAQHRRDGPEHYNFVTGLPTLAPPCTRSYIMACDTAIRRAHHGCTESELALAAPPRGWVSLRGSDSIQTSFSIMPKRTSIRSTPGPHVCTKCRSGRLERETTVKGGTTSVQWKCNVCSAVFPIQRKAG